MVKLRPLYDRIVVDPIEEDDTTTSGLIIPDSAKEKPQTGRVMAIGNGKRLDSGAMTALDVRVGDRVLFGKYSGSNISVDGTEYVIIREDDVLGILFSAA
jgi:chaperonin GroES